MAFGQIGDPGAGFRPQAERIFAEDFGPAVAGMGHAQKHSDGGRFARPVAPEQPVDRALGSRGD